MTTFVIIKRNGLKDFHTLLNSYLPRYTIHNKEMIRQLLFLDVLVNRQENGNLENTVCHKAPTLHAFLVSTLTICYHTKESCVRTLYGRVRTYSKLNN